MDILCFTAFPDEFLALQRAVHHPWQETLTACGSPYLTTDYAGLKLGLVHLFQKSIAHPQQLLSLATSLDPRLIAMAGICQGNRAKVELGDLIVAQTIWALLTATKTRHEFYILDHPWQNQLLQQSPTWRQHIQTPRPKSSSHQRGWFLHTLYDHELKPDHCLSPREHPERHFHCPDWPLILEELVAEELLNADPLRLTAAAIDLIRENQPLHLATGFPHDPVTPTVHLGAIADIAQVDLSNADNQNIFNIQPPMLGLDVGSYAVATLAAQLEYPLIVVKAVQSYRTVRDDVPFRTYAAEAAAQFFLGFLRSLAASVPITHSSPQ